MYGQNLNVPAPLTSAPSMHMSSDRIMDQAKQTSTGNPGEMTQSELMKLLTVTLLNNMSIKQAIT